MKFYRQTLFTIVFFTFQLLSSSVIFAQSEDTTKFAKQTIDNQFDLNPVFLSDELIPAIFNLNNFVFPGFKSSNLNGHYFINDSQPSFKGLTFGQSKTTNLFPNLGVSENYNNSLVYTNNNLTLDFNFGLLKQNTILTSEKPNFQFTFGTSLEYEINPWLSLYLYGKYLLPTINRSNNFSDPFTTMNPMFFQTETGGGLRTKYKNIKADVGLKKIYDTQFNQSNPVNSMNTKISIGF